MIEAIAKLISAILDLPALWMRWRSHRKDVKIEKLEVAIAERDAKVDVEHLHQQYVEKQEIQKKKIHTDAQSKTLDDVASYFSRSK